MMGVKLAALSRINYSYMMFLHMKLMDTPENTHYVLVSVGNEHIILASEREPFSLSLYDTKKPLFL